MDHTHTRDEDHCPMCPAKTDRHTPKSDTQIANELTTFAETLANTIEDGEEWNAARVWCGETMLDIINGRAVEPDRHTPFDPPVNDTATADDLDTLAEAWLRTVNDITVAMAVRAERIEQLQVAQDLDAEELRRAQRYADARARQAQEMRGGLR